MGRASRPASFFTARLYFKRGGAGRTSPARSALLGSLAAPRKSSGSRGGPGHHCVERIQGGKAYLDRARLTLPDFAPPLGWTTTTLAAYRPTSGGRPCSGVSSYPLRPKLFHAVTSFPLSGRGGADHAHPRPRRQKLEKMSSAKNYRRFLRGHLAGPSRPEAQARPVLAIPPAMRLGFESLSAVAALY